MQLGALYPWAVAHASWSLVISLELVFWIGDMLHVSGPAASAAAAFIALLRCGAVASCVDDRGPMGPGIAWSCVIFCVAQSNG